MTEDATVLTSTGRPVTSAHRTQGLVWRPEGEMKSCGPDRAESNVVQDHASGRCVQVGAHGNPHQLRNGGDVGFLERISENRRGV